MARPSAKDPLDKYRWQIEIQSSDGGFIRLGFTMVETPHMIINERTYPEGGAHLFPKKIVDSVEYRPIALERGVTENEEFTQWASEYIEVIYGPRKKYDKKPSQPEAAVATFLSGINKLVGAGNPDNNPSTERTVDRYRKDIAIRHLDRQGNTVKAYILRNAYPIEFKPASDFSSEADDGFSIERVVLAYEAFEVKTIGTDNNPINPKDILKRITRRI